MQKQPTRTWSDAADEAADAADAAASFICVFTAKSKKDKTLSLSFFLRRSIQFHHGVCRGHKDRVVGLKVWQRVVVVGLKGSSLHV